MEDKRDINDHCPNNLCVSGQERTEPEGGLCWLGGETGSEEGEAAAAAAAGLVDEGKTAEPLLLLPGRILNSHCAFLALGKVPPWDDGGGPMGPMNIWPSDGCCCCCCCMWS